MSDTNLTQDELATLKARADLLGISYHPSIGLEKLRDKIAATVSDDTDEEPDVAAAPPVTAGADVVVPETEAQRRKRKKLEATALVRIRLSCLNPAKKEWEGEIFTVGNSLVGSMTKFIPFNADDGWHIPKMMYQQLKERQCQVFITTKSKNGVSVRQGRLIKEFAIEVLPQLTTAELRDLAQRQAVAQSLD